MLIERQMDQEIDELRQMIDDMGSKVLAMLELCTSNVAEGRGEVFDDIFGTETDVNRLQMKIDDLAWKIMALYQPTASDLRRLIGAIKVAADLERAGDEVCAMCRRIMEVNRIEGPAQAPQLIEMQTMVKSLLKDGLFAVKELNEGLAESIFKADDAIDEAFQELFEWVRQGLKQNDRNVELCLAFLSMGRSLERIADHATNLAEIAIFIKKGQDVRHHSLKF
ncbi:MAG: phosphate signaling complex protein PhoU [Candidatus Riflebacteria bacterium]|nr:phosphate signaling complex protein PhoU [Candidatus Riflebacteria bacterium]